MVSSKAGCSEEVERSDWKALCGDVSCTGLLRDQGPVQWGGWAASGLEASAPSGSRDEGGGLRREEPAVQ